MHDIIIRTVTLYSYSTIQWYQSFMIISTRLDQDLDEFKMGYCFILFELMPRLVLSRSCLLRAIVRVRARVRVC
jgi:hypothetical protein